MSSFVHWSIVIRGSTVRSILSASWDVCDMKHSINCAAFSASLLLVVLWCNAIDIMEGKRTAVSFPDRDDMLLP